MSLIFQSYLVAIASVFNSYANIAETNCRFRSSLTLFNDIFFSLDVLLYSDAWSVQNERFPNHEFEEISIQAARGVQQVLGTSNFISMMIQQTKKSGNELMSCLKTGIFSSENERQASWINQNIENTEFEVSNFHGVTASPIITFRVSTIAYYSDFVTALEKLENNLLRLKPYMMNKLPPYGIDKTVSFDQELADSREKQRRNN